MSFALEDEELSLLRRQLQLQVRKMKTATSTSAKSAAKKTVVVKTAVKTAAKKTSVPVVDKKMAAANDVAEVTPKSLINDAVAVLSEADKKEALNLAELNRPALTDEAKAELDKKVAEIKAAPVKEKKIKLTLPKLRRVGDIKNVLSKGGLVVRENGLYRLRLATGELQPVSKRRCVSMITKKIVVPAEGGWSLAPEAPAK
jgi:hypothetical protein